VSRCQPCGKKSSVQPSMICVPPLQTLIFSCNVREKHSQTILLSNPSNEPWTVKPVIEGDHWKGPECIHLEGNQQDKPYKITYEPLTMSSEEREHQVCELSQYADPPCTALIAHPALGRTLDKMASSKLELSEILCWAPAHCPAPSGLTASQN